MDCRTCGKLGFDRADHTGRLRPRRLTASALFVPAHSAPPPRRSLAPHDDGSPHIAARARAGGTGRVGRCRAGARAAPKSLADAVSAAASGKPQLSTLLAAVKASGLLDKQPAGTKWTILAPTNAAFESRVRKALGVAPSALLEDKPATRALLAKVLQYHVIPAGALKAGQLKDGQTLATALRGAAPLKVTVRGGRGRPAVTFTGATDSARVVTPDITAGGSVIHVIDDVLLPSGVGTQAEKGRGGGGAAGRPTGRL